MAEDVCPIWVGHLPASPLRRLLQDPRKILAPHLREGMTALDVGCAMGFFSLPMAALVGPSGRVVCTDLQEGMLEALERRARKAGLAERLEFRHCSPETLGLGGWEGRIDFAPALAVAHEVPDRARLFAEIHAALKPGGGLLQVGPRGHVKPPDFERTLAAAAGARLTRVGAPEAPSSQTALLRKTATGKQAGSAAFTAPSPAACARLPARPGPRRRPSGGRPSCPSSLARSRPRRPGARTTRRPRTRPFRLAFH